MVYRVFVEKKSGFANEAAALLNDVNNFLGISTLTGVRLFNRYDAENITRELFDYSVKTVFSEPQVDNVYDSLDTGNARCFAVEYLPGQFDQRADSAAQCIQLISQGDRPVIRSAKVYALYGDITDAEYGEIKKYVINPVEAREAGFELPETLSVNYTIPDKVEILSGFNELSEAELENFLNKNGLAMDIDDLKTCQAYFVSEDREPTITEIKMIDTYWSDHCRHTTFNTIIDSVTFEDDLVKREYEHYLKVREELGRTKPICLMDIGTIAMKALKKAGKLDKLDESEEVNACTVKIEIEADGEKENWLLLFKNETHNHPTEIEPFGGAATCIGGAIRDPLSGRSYVYGAMRLTGAADPLKPVNETIPGKLPQRKIVTTAANGYSSYGNQIGLATGIVDEIYHPGYAAKRMEIGAVIAAAPEINVKRYKPEPGDAVIYLGGSTGRDGIGGATGSSKAHNAHSVEDCGAEVQKGNAPEERKLQRLFRNEEASKLIKRCNDFGAGGVSVAIGELADGLDIDLNAVPKKYEGLDGTELAISESQERMAVVVADKDAERFMELAAMENLQAVVVARIKAEPRLTMTWNGTKIVDISRAFLDTNGAEKHVNVKASAPLIIPEKAESSFTDAYKAMAADLNCCSKRGLSERFDSTIGAGTVLMPFGGKYQLTPIQAMVQKISVEKKHTDDCSLMSWGYDPYIMEKSPFHGAYFAVADSIAKLIASGAEFKDIYLTFQEYFEKLGKDPDKWGKPLSALLGAFRAQMELGIAAIGGKDSMSGSFEDIHVPPTLVSFAVTTQKTKDIVSPEFKSSGHKAVLLSPVLIESEGLPEIGSLKSMFGAVTKLLRDKKAVSAYALGPGGVSEAVMKMCFGNLIGFTFDSELKLSDIFGRHYLNIILELSDTAGVSDIPSDEFNVRMLGETTNEASIEYCGEKLGLLELLDIYEGKLESVYTSKCARSGSNKYESFSYKAESWPAPNIKTARPKVVIPAFPGTNCEYDSAKVFADAGADAQIFVVRNFSSEAVSKSVEDFAKLVRDSQMIFIPGGFSSGDEPDGSGKFITAFFRNQAVKDAVTELLDERGGLIAGICNGFQALIKLGLVPYGRIIDTDETCPTLTFNSIGRHQSKITRVKVASNKSPWLSYTAPGDIYSVPISHGEGRFIAEEKLIRKLADNGQIATQYVDLDGDPSSDVNFNPNNSMYAIEGITSPDGRIFGKMGHAERIGLGLYKNVPGNYDIHMFEAAVRYFQNMI